MMPSNLLVEILLLSAVYHLVYSHSSHVNCSYLQSKVPKPQLKYMLSGEVYVIWREDRSVGFNYTAHMCCTKLQSHQNFACPNTCPQFKALTNCNPGGSGSSSKQRQCNMSVSQYFTYTVYLSGDHQRCQLKGKFAKIWPRLSIAYPGPVPKFSVYSQMDSLIIEWRKRFQYVQLLYSLRCIQLHKTNRVYFCCIRSSLPYGISSYYSEVCKISQDKAYKAIINGIHCGSSHDCKTAEVDDLSNFRGQLMPDDTNWPNIPPSMFLQVLQRKRRT